MPRPTIAQLQQQVQEHKEAEGIVEPTTQEKIVLQDALAIKHKLDQTAADVVLKSGYEEDHLISNVKIALGTIGVAVAVYSHFGAGKFPDNWWTVFTCVVIYCIINLVLMIFGHIKEGHSFLITHPKPGSEYGVRVSSHMDRYSDQYTLTLSSANKWEDREVKMQVSVTDYFHEDGYLAEHKFSKDVAKLLKQYELLDASSAPRPKALNPGKQD